MRRPTDPREAAEAAFRKTAAPQRMADPRPGVPGIKETVSLRLDQEVLHRFQEDGPGWQDRVNAALRKAAGLD